MANIFNTFLQELGASGNVKDYQHASKIFVDSNYRLSPKYAFLFHVAFDINTEISRLPRDEILEMGMLVKTATLPKFTVDTKTFNAYNRVNIVQNKLKYDPVTIVFHDDSADVIRDFWYDYYSYYYRDSDYTPASYKQQHKYNPRQTQQWGYTPTKYSSTGGLERFVNAIRLYSLHQRRFTEYVLINPTITSFQHGEHQNGVNELMQHSMTVSFETVLYNYGYINPGVNTNFATLHYDNTPSPLTPQGGGTKSILGPGGLLSAIDGIDNQLGQGNLLGAGLTAWKAFNNFNGQNIGQMASVELKQLGTNILTGNNPLSKIQIPSLGGLVNSGGVANSPINTGLVATAGTGLLGTLLGGQRGGPLSPTGASDPSTVAATAATRLTTQTGGILGGIGGLAGAAFTTATGAIGKLFSNGQNVAGSTQTSTGVPSVPVTKNSDGSVQFTDPVTRLTYNTATDGSVTTTDSSGQLVSQTDSTGRQIIGQDSSGNTVELSTAQAPTESDSQAAAGIDTNINTDASNSSASDQGQYDGEGY